MLDRSFVEKIESMAETKVIEADGMTFTNKPVYRVNAPEIEPLKISSLDSLVTLAKEELKQKSFFIVQTPTSVQCVSGVFCNKQRDIFYNVSADIPNINFGYFIPIEEMIINLKSKFEETPDREYLINLLGNITDTQSVNTTDDGITQQVTAKTGIQLQQKQNVKAIVRLKPYRTFTEVEQPESDFLIRLKDGAAALFEADGGAWKKKAKSNIAEYLNSQLSEFDKITVAE